MEKRLRAVIRRRFFVLVAIAALSGGWAAAPSAQTLPSGGAVVGGHATITQPSPTQLNINASTTRSAINWQSFSIGAGYGVAVQQPSATSMQLENVVGTNVSQIFGALRSNGRLVIANPNGIWFGPSAQIDVAGLAATTAHPTATDIDNFTAGGNLALSQSGNPTAAVVNQGTITVAQEGLAALVAPGVSNAGVIQAKLGTVHLASGTTATLDFYGDGLISLAVNGQTLARAINPATGKPVTAAVQNAGTLKADGGTVLLTANTAQNVVNDVINTAGVVQARAVSQQGGMIVLDGGGVGTVRVAGSLDASGKSAGQTGGTVKVLGNDVHLANTAAVDVSGDAGGGTALVGGNFRGAGPERDAATTTVDRAATIRADALTSGTGGNVAIWSNNLTSVDGTISATGGARSGNGGRVETSGEHLSIGADASVSTAAPAGQAGNWLLDPSDVTITSSSCFQITCSGTTWTPTAGVSSSTIDTSTLDAALDIGSVTIVTTNTGGGGTGNITVSSPISWSSGTKNTTLTLTADNNVYVNASITGTGVSGYTDSLVLTATSGAVTVAAPISVNGSVTAKGASGIVLNDGTNTPMVSSGKGQTYSSAVTLDANATLADTGGGAIVFSKTIDGTTAGTQSLTVNTTGTTTFSGAVGGTIALASVTMDTTDTTGTTKLNGGAVTTAGGGQSYGGAVTLGADTALADSGGGAINFGSTISGAHALTTNTSGTTSFGGAVGTLASLSVSGVGGATALNGGAVTTSGNQTYSGVVTLGADATLSATGAGATITFDGNVSGAHKLTISKGATTLPGSVSTTGGQSYGGAVTLAADTTLADSGGGAINFGSTIGGAHALTTNTTGATSFGGAVGTLASLMVDGTTAINGGSITTSGAQTYTGAATLNATTTLTGSAVSFDGTLDSATTAARALTVSTGAGAITLTGNVGATNGLGAVALDSTGTATIDGTFAASSLSVSGATALNGGTITTSGTQTYSGAVTLGENTTLTTTNHLVTLGVVSGSGDTLTVSTGSGGASFGGATLATLSIATTGAVSESAGITATNLLLTGAGTFNLSGANDIGTLAASTGSGSITLNNGANSLAIGAVGSTNGITTGTLILTDTGTVSQTQPISATNLSLLGAGGGYTLTNPSNNVTTLAGNTGSVNFADSHALKINTVGGTSNLTASGAITLTTDSITLTPGTGLISDSGQTTTIQPLTPGTAMKLVAGSGTGFFLNSNELGYITAGTLVFGGNSATGTLTLSGGAIVGPSSIGTIELITGGNESISGSGTSLTAANGKNLVLATGGTFTNGGNSGALAASGGGTWQIWSQVQANDNLNGLQYAFKQYNAAFGSGTVRGTGNGYLLAEAPTVSIGLASASKVYDGTTSASPIFSTSTTPAGLGDSLAVSDTSASYATRNVGTGLSVTANGLAVTATNTSPACASSSCAVYGYQVSNAGGTVTASIGTITVRPITVTAATNTKTYDGTTAAAATPTITGGSLGSGDTAGFSESYGTKNVGTGLTLTPTGTVSDGNGGANYAVTFITNATGAITPRPVTVIADNATKYASRALTFTGTEFTIAGTFVGDDKINSVTLVSPGAAANVPIGKYAIVPSAAVGLGLAQSNYSITYQNGTLSAFPSIVGSIMNTYMPSSMSGNPSIPGLSALDFGNAGLTGTLRPAGETLSTGSPLEEKSESDGKLIVHTADGRTASKLANTGAQTSGSPTATTQSKSL